METRTKSNYNIYYSLPPWR